MVTFLHFFENAKNGHFGHFCHFNAKTEEMQNKTPRFRQAGIRCKYMHTHKSKMAKMAIFGPLQKSGKNGHFAHFCYFH